MKKYIIPAVDVTAMRVENSLLVGSFEVRDDVVVGGDDDASEGVGQLTQGWNADDWTRSDD